MGDHFVLLVDRLLTESTLEAAIESRNRSLEAAKSTVDDSKVENSTQKIEFRDISTPGKVVECRICQDEDEDSNMETPCSCCGSLKYAHRRCVQRWCNEKGDTTCEICQPAIQAWLHSSTSPFPVWTHSIELQFMILLILRHTLPLILNGANEFTFQLFLILFLRTLGIVLPIYVMVRAVTAFQRHRHQPEPPSSSSNEETQHSTTPQPHAQILHVI
ncbi:hypothetical protein Pint_22210 [Pistacia integerrima]|uniref:Uncharacterized protein n=1 Tax=Pistacia integerrima TaxID=434235 RepID=A0ACC0YME1_9ROSI|nr:hypothetical protein Pint_22210 [Pistacia integerrima]